MIDALDQPIRDALSRVWRVLPEARLVGGAVRDLLADRPVADIDLATPEPPDQVLDRLRVAGIKSVPTGLAHGTVTAVIDGRPFEVTTLREDTETDGRHATVSWTADWRADAARRDFTINAMSLSANGALHDFFGGRTDLQDGLVRFVGEAGRRIEEDGLRILRFFRFQARFGRGEPDEAAIAAIGARLRCLDKLSAERIWMELSRLLEGPQPGRALALMQQSGVLQAVLPGAAAARVDALDANEAPPDAILRLAALANGDPGWAEAVATRLKLSRNDQRQLLALLRPMTPAEAGTDENSLRRRLGEAPVALVVERSWLAGEAEAVRERLRRIEPPVFPLAGHDAVRAGIPPGPEVGRILVELRRWWLAGGCWADRNACLDRLRALASSAPG